MPLYIPAHFLSVTREHATYEFIKKYISPNCQPKTEKPKLSACALVFLTAHARLDSPAFPVIRDYSDNDIIYYTIKRANQLYCKTTLQTLSFVQ